ncbi:MAG: PaaI family thioesterase [Chloroflexi bacterium]|nr:PaaI family thioesterase [Chloroflexota bacterium]
MANLVADLQASVAGFFPAMLGIRFLTAAPDRVTAELMVRDEFCTVPGIMHGGAVMAFADTLGGAATSLNLPPEHGTTTIESKTNFFAPGVPGKKVLGECAALHRGKRTLVWQTKVTNEEGRLLALVTQTQMVLEPRRSPQQVMAGLFEGLDAGGQEALLARLERGGAQVYRQLAETERDDGRRAALLAAAGREEENAALLEKQPT